VKPVIALVGRPNVGKSTLFNRITKTRDAIVADYAGLTRDRHYGNARLGKRECIVIDTGGFEPTAETGIYVEMAKQTRQAVAEADVVLDCSDNFETRHAINAACVRHGVPLVSGAAVQFDGQISVFDPRDGAGPCYACAFPAQRAPDPIACATMGVFAPVVGVIGCMQAAQALMLLGAFGEPLRGSLLMLDGRSMEWTRIRIPRQPACSVCGSAP
jgi:small GTP-binding protein